MKEATRGMEYTTEPSLYLVPFHGDFDISG
jgi:hypothetical protein